MSNVKRHTIDRALSEKVIQWQKSGVSRCLENIERDPSLLSDLINEALGYAGYLSFLDPASPEVERSFGIGAQAASALFRLATAPTGEIEASFDGEKPLRLRKQISNDLVNVSDWTVGFYAAAISRDVEALDALCQVPVDLLRRSVTQSDEYSFLYAQALQHFWHEDDDTAQVLLDALKATKVGRYEISSNDYVLDVAVPQMELLFRRLEGNAPGFNAALEAALIGHRQNYSRGDQQRDPVGFVALGPLALCCFAADSGLAITVQSDYLLPRLIENTTRTTGAPPPASPTPAAT